VQSDRIVDGKEQFGHGDMHFHRLDVMVGLAIQLVQDLRQAMCKSMTKGLEV
jgi:hypothetical protein